MQLIIRIVCVLLGILSMAAGAMKVALAPQEVEFLHQFGLSNTLIILHGVIQLIGGVLLFLPRRQTLGAMFCLAGFSVSSVLILSSGQWLFGAVSTIPALLAGLIVLCGYRASRSTSAEEI